VLDPWVRDLVEEAASFPTGVNDDQVDAMTQALIRMAQGSAFVPRLVPGTNWRQKLGV